MLKITTCVSLVCDVCGGTDDEDSDPHFVTESEALEWAVAEKWSVLAGGRLSCRYCTGRALCEAEGHVWESWKCWCACQPGKSLHPEVPRRPDGSCSRWRTYCERCGVGTMRDGVDTSAAVA